MSTQVTFFTHQRLTNICIIHTPYIQYRRLRGEPNRIYLTGGPEPPYLTGAGTFPTSMFSSTVLVSISLWCNLDQKLENFLNFSPQSASTDSFKLSGLTILHRHLIGTGRGRGPLFPSAMNFFGR